MPAIRLRSVWRWALPTACGLLALVAATPSGRAQVPAFQPADAEEYVFSRGLPQIALALGSIRMATMQPANQVQVRHVLKEFCRQMGVLGAPWPRANRMDCVAFQDSFLGGRCDHDGNVPGQPATSCAAGVAQDAREWLRLMHLDIRGTTRPIPRFATVAPLPAAQLQARLQAQPPQPPAVAVAFPAAPEAPPAQPVAVVRLPPLLDLHELRLPSRPATVPIPEVDPRDVFRRTRDAVWTVMAVTAAGRTSQGSAVAVLPRFLLTACHVVAGRDAVALAHGQRVLEAFVVAGDRASDRCVLRVEEDVVPVPGLRAAADLEMGERVFTLASPLSLHQTFAEGIVSALRERRGALHVQTGAAMAPGSSGGALLDARGNLVGIIVFRVGDEAALGFAVAADDFWPKP